MKNIQDLAREAIQVQDTCNLRGVLLGYHKAMCRLAQIVGSDYATHPISVLWADKVAHLAGTQYVDVGTIIDAWGKVETLAKQTVPEIPAGPAMGPEDD